MTIIRLTPSKEKDEIIAEINPPDTNLRNLGRIHAWDVALTDKEIKMLRDGVSPFLIRPNHLIFPQPPEVIK